MTDDNPTLHQCSLHQEDRRAQSEVVGVVILVGVFATVSIVVGVFVIGNVADQASDEPLVEFDVTADADNVTLVHAGGDRIDATAVDVVVRNDTAEQRDALSTFDEINGSDDRQFSPGETWRGAHSFTEGPLRVLVVHTPTNAVVYEDTVELN